MSSLTDHLIQLAHRYAEHRKLSLSRVSTLAFGDGQKIPMIVRGADLTTSRYEATMAWFSDNWPAGAEWPADVPRPQHDGDPS